MNIKNYKRKIKFSSLILAFAMARCSNLADGGQSTLIKELNNAAGNKKATLFVRESGATVPDSYQISVQNRDHVFEKSEVGNAFVVDDNHGQANLDSASIRFHWVSNDTLEIEYDKRLRIFNQTRSINEVAIFYNPK
ncbi:MAG: hypothetical protein P4L51_14510 [Puia sp.]|nr:hypothetical protein [Puia sp.]